MDLLHTAHVPAGPGPHPTIVALHGWGASAHDLLGLAPILHGGECLVLCPQGPLEVEIGPGMPRGYGWFPISRGGPPDRAGLVVALAQLRGFLDDAFARYAVDRKAVTLIGFSQGGVLAYDLALREPERWRGLVAMSSWLPVELLEDYDPPPALATLPILQTHGTDDPTIGHERAEEAREHLLAVGAKPELRSYEMGHEIRPEALRDILVWLEESVFSR